MTIAKARRMANFSPAQDPQIREILDKINAIIKNFSQPGDLKYQAGWVVPAGWLACDGSEKSREEYLDLYAVLKTYYNKTFTVDAGTDVVTCVEHGFITADPVDVFAATELGYVLPAGLSAVTTYYFRHINDNTGTLHTSAAGATADTGKIDITDTGTGMFQIAPVANFMLPDGHNFIQGWIEGDERSFGSYQDDAFQEHWHYLGAINGKTGGTRTTTNLLPGTSSDGTYDPSPYSGARGLLDRALTATASLTGEPPRTANETRPRNYAYLVLIKY